MDESDLRAQLERHHTAGYGWALNCCAHHPVEAEDVLQTVYQKILDGRARYDGRAAFRTWLFSVIRRTAADERRRYWMQKLGLARYRRASEPRFRQDSPADRLDRTQIQAVFQEALARLPQRQHEVLHLVFYQDLSLREAADVLGVSLGSVRRHYERGKRRLRQWLKQWEKVHECR